MSGASKKLMGTTAAGGEALAIEDVFSTYLYAGNNSTQTITNGIDLAGEGGMVWIKSRTSAYPGNIFDTVRNNGYLETSTTNAVNGAGGGTPPSSGIYPFNSDGFTFADGLSYWNESGTNYASWTFRKAPRFFDVVTYTGDGSGGALNIAHSLGVAPGCVIVKRTDSSGDWGVWHRGSGGNTDVTGFRLNGTNSAAFSPAFLSSTMTDITFDSSSVFPDSSNGMNISGASYVAYLFAHDPLGPSGDGSDGLIACGSFTGGSSVAVDLGWEPQWVMIKRTDSSTGGNWWMYDTMRGLTSNSGTNGNSNYLFSDSSAAEAGGGNRIQLKSYGFDASANLFSAPYIYIAIRRGPMRAPESGTEVFQPISVNTSAGAAQTTNFPVDLQLFRAQSFASGTAAIDRLRGVSTTSTETSTPYLLTNTTGAETASTGISRNWGNTGFEVSGASAGLLSVFWNFRRAPGFFDVVAYTGDGAYPTARAVPHNLGVAPELIIYKCRSASADWEVHLNVSGTDYLRAYLSTNLSAAGSGSTLPYGAYAAAPDESNVYIRDAGANTVNGAGQTYIAYLFATLAGVSKVGSYTGNGTTLDIDCGFTTGARFVLIKGSSFTHDWHVFDTERGIVAGNDPFLELNTTNAENGSYDAVDPLSSGFTVNQTSVANLNANAATYIFLAIA